MHISCKYARWICVHGALFLAGFFASYAQADTGAFDDAGVSSRMREVLGGLDGSIHQSDVEAHDAGVRPSTFEALMPPRVLSSVPPVYPTDHLRHGEHPTVVLKVTVLADGSVADIAVEHTAGADFDAAAITAVRTWRFEPARRAGQVIASRIGIAVHFDLPELGTVEVAAVTSADEPVPHAHEEGDPHALDAIAERKSADFGAVAQIEFERRSELRGINDYRLEGKQLAAMPRVDAADLLKGAPGLVVARIEGDAVGHRLMLRGFDADHGQDIELTVDGVPVNQPSHIHGQGYADLGFIIPETVRRVRVVEGVYDPAQGDFAVAGSADFQLGVEERGVRLSSAYGAFDTWRTLALYAPTTQASETFAAFSLRKTDGFGKNRAATSGAVVAQGMLGSGKVRLLLHGSAYASRSSTAGVLRRDDIMSGRVGFYDVYPYPTAEAQHAAAFRTQLGATLRYRGVHGDNGELSLYGIFNDFRLLANYTGFFEHAQREPSWRGQGDLIEQLHQVRTWGLRGRYRTASWVPAELLRGTLELGVFARSDQIVQAQNLLEAPANATWDARVDASITAMDLGGYIDADVSLTRFVRLKGGVRADLLAYRVGDALQVVAPERDQSRYLAGYRRSAAGIALGPRGVFEWTPWAPFVLSVAYGEGYRSPQALLLREGESLPFTKVRSADVGVAYSVAEIGTIRVSAYHTRLGQDLVFEAAEGHAAPAGPSTRIGGVLYAQLQPLSWLRGAASATYVHATLDKPPASSDDAMESSVAWSRSLPYVPPWVVRLDASADHALTELAQATLSGRAALGFTYWSPRPLPEGAHTAAVSLLDASCGIRYRAFDVDASLLNLLDARYSALELMSASNWDPAGTSSNAPARHVIAGAPRTWLLTLGVRL